MEIQQLNLVNKGTSVTPNYRLEGRNNYIVFYINGDNDLILVGKADNNYAYWISKTKASDKETNELIFNHIANDSFQMASSAYDVFNNIDISEKELETWYCERLVRVHGADMAWKTPFGHSYGKAQIEYNGRFFAEDMATLLKNLTVQCQYREADGAYEKVLKHYMKLLEKGRNNVYFYSKIRSLIEILEQEKYLVVSDNEKIRTLYLQIQKEISTLYNQYMTAMH